MKPKLSLGKKWERLTSDYKCYVEHHKASKLKSIALELSTSKKQGQREAHSSFLSSDPQNHLIDNIIMFYSQQHCQICVVRGEWVKVS